MKFIKRIKYMKQVLFFLLALLLVQNDRAFALDHDTQFRSCLSEQFISMILCKDVSDLLYMGHGVDGIGRYRIPYGAGSILAFSKVEEDTIQVEIFTRDRTSSVNYTAFFSYDEEKGEALLQYVNTDCAKNTIKICKDSLKKREEMKKQKFWERDIPDILADELKAEEKKTTEEGAVERDVPIIRHLKEEVPKKENPQNKDN